MHACYATVAEQCGAKAERTKDRDALLGDRQVACPGCADEHAPRPA